MINTIISLVMTLAIAATLGSQIATTTYRATSVRATLAGERATASMHETRLAEHTAAS